MMLRAVKGVAAGLPGQYMFFGSLLMITAVQHMSRRRKMLLRDENFSCEEEKLCRLENQLRDSLMLVDEGELKSGCLLCNQNVLSDFDTICCHDNIAWNLLLNIIRKEAKSGISLETFSQVEMELISFLDICLLVCWVLPGGDLQYSHVLPSAYANPTAVVLQSSSSGNRRAIVCFRVQNTISSPLPPLPTSLLDVDPKDVFFIFLLPICSTEEGEDVYIKFAMRCEESKPNALETTNNNRHVKLEMSRRRASPNVVYNAVASKDFKVGLYDPLHDDPLQDDMPNNSAPKCNLSSKGDLNKNAAECSSTVSDVSPTYTTIVTESPRIDFKSTTENYFPTPSPSRGGRVGVCSSPHRLCTPETTRKEDCDFNESLQIEGRLRLFENGEEAGPNLEKKIGQSSSPISPLICFSSLSEFQSDIHSNSPPTAIRLALSPPSLQEHLADTTNSLTSATTTNCTGATTDTTDKSETIDFPSADIHIPANSVLRKELRNSSCVSGDGSLSGCDMLDDETMEENPQKNVEISKDHDASVGCTTCNDNGDIKPGANGVTYTTEVAATFTRNEAVPLTSEVVSLRNNTSDFVKDISSVDLTPAAKGRGPGGGRSVPALPRTVAPRNAKSDGDEKKMIPSPTPSVSGVFDTVLWTLMGALTSTAQHGPVSDSDSNASSIQGSRNDSYNSLVELNLNKPDNDES